MSRHLVGIDLGTSNTVVAYAAAGMTPSGAGDPQLVGPGEVAAAAAAALGALPTRPPASSTWPRLALPWAGSPGRRR